MNIKDRQRLVDALAGMEGAVGANGGWAVEGWAE